MPFSEHVFNVSLTVLVLMMISAALLLFNIVQSCGLTAASFPSSLLDIYILASVLKLQRVGRGQCWSQLTEAF